MDAIGPVVSDQIRDLRRSLQQHEDPGLYSAAADASELVLRSRIEAMRFARTGLQADFNRFSGFIQDARRTAATLGDRLGDPAQRAAAQQIASELTRYSEHAAQAFALMAERSRISTERVDPIGNEIVNTTEELFGSLRQDSNQTRESVTAGLASARTLTVLASVIAVVLAAGLGLAVVRGITGPIRAFLARFELIARGDFTQRVEYTTRDEIRDLAVGFNDLITEIGGVISGVQSTANEVAAAATEVAATSEQMATSTDHQRAQLTQVAAAIEQMAATVTEVSARTGDVSRQSAEAGEQATEGGQIVRRTVEEMGQIASQVESTAAAFGQLSERAGQIGQILTVINDIADQTNLLALNAAIEAARAGEHGRGFAVVADEVRKLAERTQEATQEVSRSIGEIQRSTTDATAMMDSSRQRVSGGVDMARQAGDSLESIVRGSTTVAQSIDSIAAAVEEQSATSAEIARSIEVISAAADEATQGANQAAAAATQLSGNAESLRELVARFRV